MCSRVLLPGNVAYALFPLRSWRTLASTNQHGTSDQIGKTYLVNALSLKHKVPYVTTITIGELAVMYPGDIVKGLRTFLGSAKYSSKTVGKGGSRARVRHREEYFSMRRHTYTILCSFFLSSHFGQYRADLSQRRRRLGHGVRVPAVDSRSRQSGYPTHQRRRLPTPHPCHWPYAGCSRTRPFDPVHL